MYQRKWCKAVTSVPSELQLSTQPGDLFLKKTNKGKLSSPYTCSITEGTNMLLAYTHVSVQNLLLFHIVRIYLKSKIFLFPSHPFVLCFLDSMLISPPLYSEDTSQSPWEKSFSNWEIKEYTKKQFSFD